MSYVIPITSDAAILPLVSSVYDSGGTLHVEFDAVKAGTATISVFNPQPVFCTTTTTQSTSTSTSTSTATSTSTSTSTRSTSTSSSTTGITATPSPSPHPECIATDPEGPGIVTVIVSATGVQGVVTVPSTGSAGPVGGAGAAVLAGASLLSAAIIGGLIQRRRGR